MQIFLWYSNSLSIDLHTEQLCCKHPKKGCSAKDLKDSRDSFAKFPLQVSFDLKRKSVNIIFRCSHLFQKSLNLTLKMQGVSIPLYLCSKACRGLSTYILNRDINTFHLKYNTYIRMYINVCNNNNNGTYT